MLTFYGKILLMNLSFLVIIFLISVRGPFSFQLINSFIDVKRGLIESHQQLIVMHVLTLEPVVLRSEKLWVAV